MVDPHESRPDAPLFLSSHLDDAVFACGEAITSSPRATVATVFAGRPPRGTAQTRWDAECGFAADEDVIGARREEDREALAALGAHPVWLDFAGDQYGQDVQRETLVEALDALVTAGDFGAVYIPLGLFRSDHVRTSDAALALMRDDRRMTWLLYEDAIYRRIPGLSVSRVDALRARGYALAPHTVAVDAEAHARKRDAVACYRSQIRGLATRHGHADAFAPERYWRITRGAVARRD